MFRLAYVSLIVEENNGGAGPTLQSYKGASSLNIFIAWKLGSCTIPIPEPGDTNNDDQTWPVAESRMKA